ncbi:type I-E CRISPR-associated protein Cse1/CasA [Actinobaculum sp. 313]|uniref:type I-E CRISPR-associated protein Cse1/CasA n=1 Tax=Actinobaculum sp. 313 TaxID=2495645 RepID=UPI000D52A280|nr:type I-E CRISPR-associated protein Cse1/CasA [Actinobaculum sp. 313]AWE41590.1 type I-E CRISPR-associated protein Cse1/CasA [Actinobaculum sp. 313]
MTDSFNLLDEPWIRIARLDGSPVQLSLLGIFREAHAISGIHGEIASQDIAILRLLLAICHRTMNGPDNEETWLDYWDNPELLADDAIAYLEGHRPRFDLRDSTAPFFQVAGIHSASDKVSGLESLIIDVPNGEPFFTTRGGEGLERISWAEAARWLIHAHAFDPSGIHTGAVGDPSVKGGKGYPIGPGWTGQIGVIAVEGETLLRTLLLNTVVPGENSGLRRVEEDLPPWERELDGPAGSLDLQPTGPVSCFTWQTRRILLHGDDDGVTGVFLGNGDKATPQDRFHYEPMSAWRYSDPQSKKLKRTVYMPRKLPTDRALWRGLPSLVSQLSPSITVKGAGEVQRFINPGVLRFHRWLMAEEYVLNRGLISVHAVGMQYGSQEAVVEELVDDTLAIPAALLAPGNERLVDVVHDAMEEAEQVAAAVRNLGGNLARAQGAEPDRVNVAAKQAGIAFYLVLDQQFPRWLAALDGADPDAARDEWRGVLRKEARTQADALAAAAPATAVTGHGEGSSRVDLGKALAWFYAALNKTLPRPETSSRSEVDTKPNDKRKEGE